MNRTNDKSSPDEGANLARWTVLAEQIARRAHQGQFRKDGVTPYIIHPAEIAASVPDALKPIAWLHDVVEDTAVTLAEMQAEGIPPGILDAVQAMTKHEGEDYAVYLDRVCANDQARQVKIVDIENNLRGQPSEKARAKYLRALPILRAVKVEVS
jgi:(p)ppGpp synthase/HD superfamily hydrolase